MVKGRSYREGASEEATPFAKVLKALEEDEQERKKNARFAWLRDRMAFIASVSALFLSLATLIFTLYVSSSLGGVQPLEPSGYAIVRGLQPDLSSSDEVSDEVAEFPSDHLVLPIEWQNRTGRSVLISFPELTLTELDGKGGSAIPNTDPLEFFMIGEFSDLSAKALVNRNTDPHTYTNSFTISPHASAHRNIVFRRKESAYGQENYNFNFDPYKYYELTVSYTRDPNGGVSGLWGHRSNEVETLDKSVTYVYTPCYVADLTTHGKGNNYGWDFFSLAPGARITTNYGEEEC